MLGPEHPSTLASANSLGGVPGQQCEYSEALMALRGAVTGGAAGAWRGTPDRASELCRKGSGARAFG